MITKRLRELLDQEGVVCLAVMTELKRIDLIDKMRNTIENHLCPDCRGKGYSPPHCVKCEIERLTTGDVAK